MDVKLCSSSSLRKNNISKSVPNIQEEIQQSNYKKGKYDHVESKVLQYRREIQRQNQENKNKRSANMKSDDKNKKTINVTETVEVTSKWVCPNCTEKDEQIQRLLQEQNKLLTENAEAAVKMDYFRLEVSRLKSILQGCKIENENSPNPSYKNKSPFRISGFLQTPIRNISNSLLRNSKSSFACNNTTGSEIRDESEPDFSSDPDSSDTENVFNNTRSKNLSLVTECSEIGTPDSVGPLLKTSQTSLKSKFKKMLNNIACINDNENVKKKNLIKFKNRNKINPLNIHSTSNTKRTVNVVKADLDEVPSVMISTPNSERNRATNNKVITKPTNVKFTLNNQRKENNNYTSGGFEAKEDVSEMLLIIVEDLREIANKIEKVIDINKDK